MTLLDIFTPYDLERLSDWFTEIGELYIDVYYPKSAGGGTPYFIRSLQDLSDLIAKQTWPQVVFTIFRRLQYPLRGIVDEALIAKALKEINDGEWYAIVSLDDYYPLPCRFMGSGDSHAEFLEELKVLIGQRTGIGKNPFDYHDEAWFSRQRDEVLHVAIRKNQRYYERFERFPEK